MTNQATRIIIKAVGELAGEATRIDFDEYESGIEEHDDTSTTVSIDHSSLSKKEKIDYKTYKPKVVGDEWIVSETDLCMDWISITFFFDNIL